MICKCSVSESEIKYATIRQPGKNWNCNIHGNIECKWLGCWTEKKKLVMSLDKIWNYNIHAARFQIEIWNAMFEMLYLKIKHATSRLRDRNWNYNIRATRFVIKHEIKLNYETSRLLEKNLNLQHKFTKWNKNQRILTYKWKSG